MNLDIKKIHDNLCQLLCAEIHLKEKIRALS
jgi:hypothetical protein